MKHIRVTLTDEYLIPDHWAITPDSKENLLSLQGDNQHYLPCLRWAKRDLRWPTGPNDAELSS